MRIATKTNSVLRLKHYEPPLNRRIRRERRLGPLNLRAHEAFNQM